MRVLRIFILALLAVPTWATMKPQYSSYVNTGSNDGHSLWATGVVDGTTTGCNLPPYCINVTHTGYMYVQLGSASGTKSQAINPAGYLSVTNNQTIPATPGVDYAVNAWGKVICTQLGLFYFLSFSWKAGVSVADMQWNGAPPIGGTDCVFDLSCPIPTKPTCYLQDYTEISVVPIAHCPADGKEFRWIYQPYTKANDALYCAPFAAKEHSITYTQCE